MTLFRRLINIVIKFEGYASVVGELQIHYRPILDLKVRGEIIGCFVMRV